MVDNNTKELVRIGKSLFTKKQPWNALCQDIAENFHPMRADFTGNLNMSDMAGDLYESSPVMARETLANAIGSMLRQNDWFDVKTGIAEIDESDTGSRALEYSTKRMRLLVNDKRSNFKRATITADHDWVAFGNSVLTVEESISRDHLVYKAHHPRDNAWLVNSDGSIDHNHRKMEMTAHAMAGMRAWNLHSDVQLAVKSEPNKIFNVHHIVVPAEKLFGNDKVKRREFRDMPFLSIYVDMDHEHTMFDGGLPVFNYVIPRWRTVDNNPQGFSPAALNALPDGRMIQDMSRLILEQGEKAVDPPMAARNELFRDDINLYSGGLTHLDLEDDEDIRKALMTINTSGSIGIGMELKQDVRELIAEAFMLNKLFLPNVREMREIEVQARLDEFRRAAIPFFEPIESEYNAPLLDVAFALGVHAGFIDVEQFPDEMQGRDIEFKFDSPLSTAEGRQDVAAFQESIQIAAAGGEADPSVPAMLDVKKMTKDAIRGTGAKPDWFKSDEQQAQEAEQAEAVERMQSMAAALQQGAGVANEVAGASVAMQEAGMT